VLLFATHLSNTGRKTECVKTPYVLAKFGHEWPANRDTVRAAAVRILSNVYIIQHGLAFDSINYVKFQYSGVHIHTGKKKVEKSSKITDFEVQYTKSDIK
jgi:hypothetical protein